MRRVVMHARCVAIPFALALLVAGCGSPPQGDTSVNTEAQAQAEAQAKALADQQACMTHALDDAVLKVQSDAATKAALDAQDLTNCPGDFVSGFVALRTSVRNYLQSHAEVIAHSGQANEAAGEDLLNLGCSIIKGEQCAPSAIANWNNVDDDLKRRDAENRDTYQKAMADLETIIARYGLYIRKTDASPESGNASAPSDGNAM